MLTIGENLTAHDINLVRRWLLTACPSAEEAFSQISKVYGISEQKAAFLIAGLAVIECMRDIGPAQRCNLEDFVRNA